MGRRSSRPPALCPGSSRFRRGRARLRLLARLFLLWDGSVLWAGPVRLLVLLPKRWRLLPVRRELPGALGSCADWLTRTSPFSSCPFWASPPASSIRDEAAAVPARRIGREC